MYRQELADPRSGLYAFRPEVVCFAFDAEHLAPAVGGELGRTMDTLRHCWRAAQEAFDCAVMQQTALPRFPLLMGSNEHRLGSQAATVQRLNEQLREAASAANVALLSVDTAAAIDGTAAWFDPALWFSAKQEVHPRASVLYGDLLGRLLGTVRGRSAKCLVLDLDNTLWGGVIGDDGLEGIVLGQGSPAGEAHVALQRYARQLAQRGVILAVCSKNDHANAIAPFESHPEMVLRREDIACFVANWQDKATNLRQIAQTLQIGLDALVFVDDNPAERRLIRTELPQVAAPELPEDPAGYVGCLSEAGYFEAIDLTAEDSERTAQYRANAEREALRETATDLDSYLRGLEMRLVWSPFDVAGLKRITQLINKTNQFNLTTERRTEPQVMALIEDAAAVTLQLRLTDVHGDNGMIGVLIGCVEGEALRMDTWLMSCRVLGRGVEDVALNLLCELALERGCTRLEGTYRPTPKNGMVRDHYSRFGFALRLAEPDGTTNWSLPLSGFAPRATPMRVEKGEACHTPMYTAS